MRRPRRPASCGCSAGRLTTTARKSSKALEGTRMPELLIDFITSLDGYGGAEGWPGFWGMEGPEYLAWLGEPAEAEHVTLMGATTYRLMYGFAADMPDDPGMAAMAEMPKVVFSSTLTAPLAWANTELI